MKTLIVEDNKIVTLGIRKTLESEFPSISVDTAENGEEALDHLNKLNQTELPFFILLDINMPIMNGIEFLVAIKKIEKYSRIPIIIHTTSSSAEDYFKCKTLGVCGYFVKHIDFKEYKKNLILITEYWMRSYTNRT